MTMMTVGYECERGSTGGGGKGTEGGEDGITLVHMTTAT
jgi:hypothetical protein